MEESRIKEIIKEELDKQDDGGSFTNRKVTDTPTDDFSVTNRRYVNLNGTIASRPASVVATMGQSYYATDINIPINYDSTNMVWRNGVGSIIASN